MHASRRVKPSEFDVVTANLRAFAARKTSCELTANAIITKENCEHLAEMALWLRDCGVEQVRFAPVWVSAPVSYHAPIRETVLRNLAKAVALQTPGFRVSHSYSVDQDSTRRHFNRCCFQEIVPVIGADQIIYRCKDTSYSEAGALASLKGRSFAKVWFSDEVVQKIRAHQPKRDCDGIQCAAEAKNVLYEKMLDSYIDPFI